MPSAPLPIPDHPDKWDMIEHLRAGLALSRNPIEMTPLATQQKPYVQSRFMGTDTLIVSDPKIIRYIFVEAAENLRLNPLRQAILKPILEDGLITAEDEVWKRARRTLAPVFTPRHTQRFAKNMDKITRELMPQILPEEGNILLSDHMLKFAYFLLSEALFSGEINADIDVVLPDVEQLLTSLGRPDPMDIIEAPKWLPRPTRLRGHGAVRRIRRMVLDITQDRRARLERGEDIPDDFLTLLLQSGTKEDNPLSDKEIEDHIVSFIGAGHETTSRALTWMYYLLSQDHKSRDKLEAEVDALDLSLPPEKWAANMPWAMACFDESMRLYPPIPFVSRQAIHSDTFETLSIQKDEHVMINIWALHRHEDLWEKPNCFRPERFLAPARNSIDRFQYLPFGAGRRVCIGQRFAVQEAAILIALISKSFRFDYIGKTPPWPVTRITVKAHNNMPMRVTRRS
ncbi:MAG: cytochrome P450 [Maricaulaceae bacterium]